MPKLKILHVLWFSTSICTTAYLCTFKNSISQINAKSGLNICSRAPDYITLFVFPPAPQKDLAHQIGENWPFDIKTNQTNTM